MSADTVIEQGGDVRIAPLSRELLEPATPSVDSPVTPRVDRLPLHGQGWQAFESLMVAVVREAQLWTDVRQYGVPGEKQHGIDLLGYGPQSQ